MKSKWEDFGTCCICYQRRPRNLMEACLESITLPYCIDSSDCQEGNRILRRLAKEGKNGNRYSIQRSASSL